MTISFEGMVRLIKVMLIAGRHYGEEIDIAQLALWESPLAAIPRSGPLQPQIALSWTVGPSLSDLDVMEPDFQSADEALHDEPAGELEPHMRQPPSLPPGT